MQMFVDVLTDELVQEDEWSDVASQTQELGHDHEPVPRLHRQRHHEQLGQDQRGEWNRHDVHKLRLEEQQSAVHDDAACGAHKPNHTHTHTSII